jgi:hypothetical protein
MGWESWVLALLGVTRNVLLHVARLSSEKRTACGDVVLLPIVMNGVQN